MQSPIFLSDSLSSSKLIELVFSHQYGILEPIWGGDIYGVNKLKP